MRSPAKILGVAAALAILAGLAYFLYLLLTTSDQTRLAVLTAAVSVGTLIYTQNLNSRREIAGRQFAKKAEAYEEIISEIASLMRSSRREEDVDQDALLERLETIIPKMMIWAGPEVLKAWQKLASPSDSPMGPIFAGGELITALRKELGHSDDASLGPLGAFSTILNADARAEMNAISAPD